MRSCSFSAAGLWTNGCLGLATGALGARACGLKTADSPQPASETSAQHNGAPACSPEPAHPLLLAPSHTVHHDNYSYVHSGELIPAQKLNLSRPKHFNSRPTPRFNEAPNTNTLVFQRLRCKSRCLEIGERPPWNSHSKVPCPIPSKVQVCGCPCLPDGQDLALDQRKAPDPGQNIARTFGVFYGRGVGPDAFFCLSRRRLRGQQRGAHSLSATSGETSLTLRQKSCCTRVSAGAEIQRRSDGHSGRAYHLRRAG